MKILTGLCLLLAGCATADGYKKKTEAWVGRTGAELVAEWGVPIRSLKLPNGHHAYEYVEDQFTTYECSTSFVSDEADVIKTVRFAGVCVAR